MPTLEQRIAAWRPGESEDHPTGGYDAIFHHGEETSYFRRGVRHRTDGPAKIIVRRGITVEEEWHRKGVLHRDDGPAVTTRLSDGTLFEERWMQNDFTHREGEPAVLRYDRGGNVVYEDYRLESRSHRLDGPALRTLTPPAREWEEGFFVHGEGFTAEEHERVVEALGSGAPFEWALAYARGDEG